MRLTLVSSLLPLAVSVGALSVTEPKKGAEVDPSDSFTVKWDSVSTDPSSFDIYLVNNAVYPNVEKKIASDVDTSDGSYTVDKLSVTDGHGFQINLFSNEDKNTGILAQSEQFNMTGDASSTSSTSSTSSSSGTSSSTSTSASSTETETTSTKTGTKTESTSASSTSDSDSDSSSSSSSTSDAGSSAASSSGAAASSTGVPQVDDNAGVAIGAPLTVITGLVGAAFAFSL